MLDTIIEFFDAIWQTITSCIDFLIGMVEDIVFLVQLTASFVAKIPDMFSWLPAEAVTLVVGAFAVVVIYKVLGREG